MDSKGYLSEPPSPPLQAIIFDLDGTLIDSRGDIALACNRMLNYLGLPQLEEKIIGAFVGDGARTLVERALLRSGASAEHAEAALEHFLRFYEADPVVTTRLLPGVEVALAECRDLLFAICTNKPRRTAALVVERLGLTKWIPILIAGGDTVEKKPHPEPVRRAAGLLGVDAKRTLMVGDGHQDVLAGRAAGAVTVGVRGGIIDEASMLASQPDFVIDEMGQLPALIRKHFAQATSV